MGGDRISREIRNLGSVTLDTALGLLSGLLKQSTPASIHWSFVASWLDVNARNYEGSHKHQATSCDKLSRVNLFLDSSIKPQAAAIMQGDKKNL